MPNLDTLTRDIVSEIAGKHLNGFQSIRFPYAISPLSIPRKAGQRRRRQATE